MTQRVALQGDDVIVNRVVQRADGEPETIVFTYVTDGQPHAIPAEGGRSGDGRRRALRHG